MTGYNIGFSDQTPPNMDLFPEHTQCYFLGLNNFSRLIMAFSPRIPGCPPPPPCSPAEIKRNIHTSLISHIFLFFKKKQYQGDGPCPVERPHDHDRGGAEVGLGRLQGRQEGLGEAAAPSASASVARGVGGQPGGGGAGHGVVLWSSKNGHRHFCARFFFCGTKRCCNPFTKT